MLLLDLPCCEKEAARPPVCHCLEERAHFDLHDTAITKISFFARRPTADFYLSVTTGG